MPVITRPGGITAQVISPPAARIAALMVPRVVYPDNRDRVAGQARLSTSTAQTRITITRLVLKPVCLWMIVDIVVISEDRVISVLLVCKSMAPDLYGSNARANSATLSGAESNMLQICN